MKLRFTLSISFLVLSAIAKAEIKIQQNYLGVGQILDRSQIFLDRANSESIDLRSHLSIMTKFLNTLQTVDLRKISGYKNTKVWIAFRLANQSDLEDFLLRYVYPSMQNIEFFIYDQSGSLVNYQISGKLVPFEKRLIKDTDFLFPFKIAKGQTLSLFMSFQSSGSMQIPIEILSAGKFHELTQTKYLFYGFYYGVIFLILIYTIFLAITLKDIIYIYYLFYVLSVVFSQMGLHGISYLYIWPNFHWWNKVSTIFFVGLMFFSLSIFSSIALDLKKNNKWLFRLMSSLTITSGLVSFLSLVAYGNTLIRITGIITSLLPLIVIPSGIGAWKKGNTFAPYYLIAVIFYLTGASLYGLKDLRPI